MVIVGDMGIRQVFNPVRPHSPADLIEHNYCTQPECQGLQAIKTVKLGRGLAL